jgi:hypothetical protein
MSDPMAPVTYDPLDPLDENDFDTMLDAVEAPEPALAAFAVKAIPELVAEVRFLRARLEEINDQGEPLDADGVCVWCLAEPLAGAEHTCAWRGIEAPVFAWRAANER